MEKSDKIIIIKGHLNKIRKMKGVHYKKWRRYQSIHARGRVMVNVLNGLSISSLVVSLSVFPPIVIGTLVVTAISTVGTICMDTYDVVGRSNRHHTSYCQLDDLYGTIQNKLSMSSTDLDILLSEIISMTGLINDQGAPVSLSDSM